MIFTSSLSLRWSKEFLRLADLLINTKNYIISNSTFLSRFSNFLHLFSFERLKSFSSSSLALPINISLSKSKSDLLTFSQLSHLSLSLPRMKFFEENPFHPFQNKPTFFIITWRMLRLRRRQRRWWEHNSINKFSLCKI